MRELVAPGIYLCGTKHHKRYTVQRFYLNFAGFLQNKHFYDNTIRTMEYLGNTFFKENAGRYKFISFRPTKDRDGFYLTMGKECDEVIIELVRSLCGFIVGIKEDKSPDVSDLTGARIIASDHYVLLYQGSKPTRL